MYSEEGERIILNDSKIIRLLGYSVRLGIEKNSYQYYILDV